MQGTYLLILRSRQDLQRLAIGRLGVFDFAAGYYLYAGSAHGAGGLPARMNYHLRRVKERPHWHVDYLRACTDLIEYWTIGSELRLEVALCRALAAQPELSLAVPRFGASDTGEPGHLFYSRKRPGPSLLLNTIMSGLTIAAADPDTLTVDVTVTDEDREG